MLEKFTRRSQTATRQESGIVTSNPLLHLFYHFIQGNARDRIWW